MTPRILVTGSRDWTRIWMVRETLEEAWTVLGSNPQCRLVHGACHLGGADIIAETYWRAMERPYEGHPAQRVNGKTLGPERNQRMVDLGADLCIAFPLANSRGTWDCVRRAEDAGIPVRVVKEP